MTSARSDAAAPVLVLGAGGFLGRAVVRALEAAGRDFTALDHARCDIADGAAVGAALRASGARLVVNCAARANVDACEADPAGAFRANALGPRVVAVACRQVGARLVHMSTNQVFSGDRVDGPYTEVDSAAPVNVYGRTKLYGERAVLAALPEAICIRTGILFGPDSAAFASRIPAVLLGHGTIEAFDDLWITPTSVDDLARWIVDNAERAAGRLYNVANQGAATYSDMARVAAAALGLDPSCVHGRSVSSAGLAAPRPPRTPLASLALPAEGLPVLPPWEEAYAAFARACTPPAPLPSHGQSPASA